MMFQTICMIDFLVKLAPVLHNPLRSYRILGFIAYSIGAICDTCVLFMFSDKFTPCNSTRELPRIPWFDIFCNVEPCNYDTFTTGKLLTILNYLNIAYTLIISSMLMNSC